MVSQGQLHNSLLLVAILSAWLTRQGTSSELSNKNEDEIPAEKNATLLYATGRLANDNERSMSDVGNNIIGGSTAPDVYPFFVLSGDGSCGGR